MTAAAIHWIFNSVLQIPVDLRHVCVLLGPWMDSNTTLVMYWVPSSHPFSASHNFESLVHRQIIPPSSISHLFPSSDFRAVDQANLRLQDGPARRSVRRRRPRFTPHIHLRIPLQTAMVWTFISLPPPPLRTTFDSLPPNPCLGLGRLLRPCRGGVPVPCRVVGGLRLRRELAPVVCVCSAGAFLHLCLG